MTATSGDDRNGLRVRPTGAIGVNWGSLDQSLLARLMDQNARRPEPAEARR